MRSLKKLSLLLLLSLLLYIHVTLFWNSIVVLRWTRSMYILSPFMQKIFKLRTSCYSLRNPNDLAHIRPNQITLGSHSLISIGPQICNTLPNELKSAENLTSFKRLSKNLLHYWTFWQMQRLPVSAHTKKCVYWKGHLLTCASVGNIAQRQIYFIVSNKVAEQSLDDTC